MASLILAVRFLTIAPVLGREAAGPGALGRAAWWFPVVGLAIGGALGVFDHLLAFAVPPLLAAILVLAAWKAITGGVHLDGLADCLDGLAGGDRERRLAIMADSRIGVFGALGLILTLLVAFAALAGIPLAARARTLLIVPAIGRLTPLIVAPLFGAATPGRGIGAAFLVTVPRAAGPVHLVAIGTISCLLLGWTGAAMVASGLGVGVAWSAFLARQLGGLTGDGLGAAVELSELAALVAAASSARGEVV